MKSWVLVRFSREELATGIVGRLMRELLPLALEIHNFTTKVGVELPRFRGH